MAKTTRKQAEQKTIRQKKIELTPSDERRFKVQCILMGRSEQEIIGDIIRNWTEKQEKQN